MMIFAFLLLTNQTSQAKSPSTYIKIQGVTMGTTYTIKASAQDRKALQKEIHKILHAIDQKMSTYRPDSELNRFNKHKSTEWFPVSEELGHIFKESRRLSEFTGGAFDITVGKLVNIWGFGPISRQKTSPSTEALKELLKSTGFKHLQIQSDHKAIRKSKAELQCDLSAIAKGYAVDKLSQHFNSIKITDYLIEIGGEIKVKGQNPHGKKWAIGIQDPANRGSLAKTVYLEDKAIATSGHYNNYFIDSTDKKNPTRSHIINPHTGAAGIQAANATVSATVIHDSCMIADALATGFLLMGSNNQQEAIFALSKKHNLAVYLIDSQKTPRFQQMSQSFEAFTKQ